MKKKEDILLSVDNISLSLQKDSEKKTLLREISFTIRQDSILAIIGESGSGKSLTAMSIARLLPTNKIRIVKGDIRLEGRLMNTMTSREIRQIRGKDIGVIFQNPMSSLNPSKKCGHQVEEMLLQHKICKKRNTHQRILELFKNVKLPYPEEAFHKYPHQLSGGQKQRVMIAMAISCNPKLLIADEPTTALDVTTQKEIIKLIYELKNKTKMGVLFISHDLSLVTDIADDVLIMRAGKIVEKGSAKSIFTNPKHTYTKALLATRPPLDRRIKVLPTVDNINTFDERNNTIIKEDRVKYLKNIYKKKPLLKVIDVTKFYHFKKSLFAKKTNFKVIKGISFDIHKGETVGLVGESGCGKTTLGRIIVHIENLTSGEVVYDSVSISSLKNSKMRPFRRDIQMIFQDPYSSLNPMMTIGDAIIEPMRVHNLYESDKARKLKVLSLLDRVGLQASFFSKKPNEISGGQRQRVSIARTIALMPKLIVCDEVVSALDVSSQAQVLNLLNQLKADFGFAYLFISHDLAVVKHMSDKILVMNKGEIVEKGEADTLYYNPKSAYTKRLIAAAPKLH